jgi:two-component system alkaline phosphatase synthesis response regulator PhoP
VSVRKKILIVEDNADVRGMFSAALKLDGFDVKEANSGFQALRSLDSNVPDLVILDLGLPGIDGFAVQREIAASAFIKHISVVIVTASGADLSHLDVACVLRKPVTTERLLKTVRECLQKASFGGTGV